MKTQLKFLEEITEILRACPGLEVMFVVDDISPSGVQRIFKVEQEFIYKPTPASPYIMGEWEIKRELGTTDLEVFLAVTKAVVLVHLTS